MNYFTRNPNVIKKNFYLFIFFFWGGGGGGGEGRGARLSDFFFNIESKYKKKYLFC